MQITRLTEAKPYHAANHFDMSCLRLQGWDATDARRFWVGLSHILPGGHTAVDAAPVEKVYIAVAGTVTVVSGDVTVDLEPLDSCYLAPGESRTLHNRTNQPASVILVMPYRDNGLVGGRYALEANPGREL